MLSQKSQGAPGVWLHLDVHTAEQVDALHEEWARQKARILEPPSLRPWGMYEMRVQDLDGHVLRVSAPPKRAEA
jgi:predicted lactoylglutathione lyase